MKKKLLSVLSALWLCTSLALGQNLLVNGDFQNAESTPSGPWKVLDWTCSPSNNPIACGIERTNGLESSYGLKLGAAANNLYGYWSVSQTVQIEAGKNYLFEGYVQYGNRTDPTLSFIYLKDPTTDAVIDKFEIPFVGETTAPVRPTHLVSHLFQIPDTYQGTEVIFEFNSNDTKRIVRADNFSLVHSDGAPPDGGDEDKDIKAAIHIDPIDGNDANDGLTPATPMRSLAGVNSKTVGEGTRILFKAGTSFVGSLRLSKVSGSVDNPILISSYWDAGASSDTPPAIIDGAGELSAIRIEDGSHFRIQKLQLTANGGDWKNLSEKVELMRVGLLVRGVQSGTMENIQVSDLTIYDLFYENPGFVRNDEEAESANGTQGYGYGIRFISTSATALIKNVSIKYCDITRMSHTGVKFSGANLSIEEVDVLANKVYNVGGPGMQFSHVKNCYFAHNTIDRSGSFEDSRSWKRGSGMWMYASDGFLIEHNRLTNANGPNDSAGAHIDCNNKNIVLQYNYSANNAGAFVEILGNSWNCCYRYNISVNDGWRVVNRPVGGGLKAANSGKTLWLSGYMGYTENTGPFFSYIYNNTIYVDNTVVARYFFQSTATGILIANNIFNVIGTSASDSPYPRKENGDDVNFRNNLFLRQANWPASEKIKDVSPTYGDATFMLPGGSELINYTPTNDELVRGRGIAITNLPGDEVGLKIGLQVTKDILGNPVGNFIDMGAIGLSGLTSIDNLSTQSKLRVTADGNRISIAVPGTQAVHIYDLSGCLQYQASFVDYHGCTLSKGAYLVKVGSEVVKVVCSE